MLHSPVVLIHSDTQQTASMHVMWSFTDADVDSVQFVDSGVVTTKSLPARLVLSLLCQSKQLMLQQLKIYSFQ